MAKFGGSTIVETFESTEEGVYAFAAVEFDEGDTEKVHYADTAGAPALGIAQDDAEIAGMPIEVICFGLAKAKIDEAPVQSGAALTPNEWGDLVLATEGDYILCRAVEYGANEQDVITVLITHEGSMPAIGAGTAVDVTITAGEDLTAKQYHLVKIINDGDDGPEVVLPVNPDDDDGIRVAGILQNAPDIGEDATVRVIGQSSFKIGETIGPGDLVTVGGDTSGVFGKGIVGIATNYILGQCLTGGTLIGATGTMIITHEGVLPEV